MHFCSVCENMYYTRIGDNNNLVYYCKQCGHEDTTLSAANLCVSRIDVKKTKKSFAHMINPYTKLDPTLPRINTIQCPNADCATNTKHEEREIIYIRYDDTNQKYLFLCSTCDHIWEIKE